IGRRHRLRDLLPGKKQVVGATRRDGLAHFLLVRPEPHAMRPFATQDNRERGTPGARSHHGDVAHACFSTCCGGGTGFEPSLLSAPANIRRRFWWCLRIMSAEHSDRMASTAGETGFLSNMTGGRNRTANGKTIAAQIEPSET